MKKTIILICVALILCAAICITAVHFTGKNDVPETSDTDGVATDADTETVDIIFEDLSKSRGYGLSLVERDMVSSLNMDPYYEREDAEPTRTVTLLGKTIIVQYDETTQYAGRELKDTYKDEKGNRYNFAEDGTFLSYTGESELSGFSSALYVDKGITPDITEDEAVAIAEKLGKEVFGESFDKVKFESIKYDAGKYDVYFYQRLGADNSIMGIYCYVRVLADGTVWSYGMPNVADLRDLDESKYELITKADIEEEITVNASKVYGEKKVDFHLNEIIPIYKLNGKYALYAMSETRSGGADIYYEVTD